MPMSLRIRRVAAVTAALAVALLASPGAALASVSGPCAVTATATSTGPIDVATTNVWHIASTDQVSAAGTSETPQERVGAAISAFGFELPLGSATSGGGTTISTDLFDASLLAAVGRIFVLHGSAAGPGVGCDASVTLFVDDVNPFLTILGAAGVAGSPSARWRSCERPATRAGASSAASEPAVALAT